MKKALMFLLILLTSLAVFALIVFGELNATLLSERYVTAKLDGSGAITAAADAVRTAVLSEYVRSPYHLAVLDGYLQELGASLIKEETVRREINTMVADLYAGRGLRFDADYYVEAYTTALCGLFAQYRLDAFMSEDMVRGAVIDVISALFERYNVPAVLDRVSEVFPQVQRLVKLGLLASAAFSGTVTLLVAVFSPKRLKHLGWTSLMAGVWAALCAYFGHRFIATYDLSAWDSAVTDLIMSVKDDLLVDVMRCGALLALLGVLLLVIHAIAKAVIAAVSRRRAKRAGGQA